MSTSAFHHPIREHLVNVYVGQTECIALIGSGNGYPFFRAPTAEEAFAKAEAFRQDAIDKHEASSIARQEAAAKARETRGRKASAA